MTATLTFADATNFQAVRSYIAQILDVSFLNWVWRKHWLRAPKQFHDRDTRIKAITFNKLSDRVWEANFELALKTRGRWMLAVLGVLLLPVAGLGLVLLWYVIADVTRSHSQQEDMAGSAAERINAILRDEVGVGTTPSSVLMGQYTGLSSMKG